MATTSSWKRALGLMKDRTSIGLAKIASTRVPDLDVAIVKATSHDDTGVDEKNVQEIIQLTFMSLAYAHACLQALTKRISKTRDWIVALKVLVVTHRLLREGNSAFQDDLRTVSRRSLNVTNFRDESHSNAWDFSAFVRNYGAYLDARLDCSLFTSAPRGVRSSQDDRTFAYSPTKNAIANPHSTMYYNSSGDRSMEPPHGKQKLTVKEMEPEMLLDFLPSLQQMVDRVLACRPTGATKNHRLVQVSLYMIVRESFLIYADLCDGMGSIMNVYFDMSLQNCSRAFDIYVRFSRQSDSLATFFTSMRGIGICRPSEYPQVEKVSQDYLDSLEGFLRDLSGSVRSKQPIHRPGNSTPKRFTGQQNEKEMDPKTFEQIYGVKALPAPPAETPQTIPKVEKLPDLIDLVDEEPSTATADNKMALSLFSDVTGAKISNNWATFDPAPVEASQNSAVSNTKWQPSTAATNSAAISGWELALVSESSNAKPVSTVDNFDRYQLETMYNQAAFQPNSAMVLSGSASSVANFARPPTLFLPLPATGSSRGQYPFAAPATVASSHYVQFAIPQQQQRYVLQEQQQQWQQAQVNGAYGPYGRTPYYSGSYALQYAPQYAPQYAVAVAPQTTLALPYYGMTGYSQGR